MSIDIADISHLHCIEPSHLSRWNNCQVSCAVRQVVFCHCPCPLCHIVLSQAQVFESSGSRTWVIWGWHHLLVRFLMFYENHLAEEDDLSMMILSS